MATDEPVPPTVAQAAVEWLLELQAAPQDKHLQERWRHWRAADPAHERAWKRIEEFSGHLAHLHRPACASVAQAALTRPGTPQRRKALRALAAMVFLGGTAGAVLYQGRWKELTADVRTGAGERSVRTLEDGTVVVINTRSAVDVRYGPTARRLRVISGEVLVTSGRDAANRPLLVQTAEGEVEAIGTRFAVRTTGDDRTVVSVFEGMVRLQPHASHARPTLLRAGFQSSFSATDVGQPHGVDEAMAAAWTDGMLIARGLPLEDFLAELSRYSPTPFSCDPEVKHLPVWGTFPLDDPLRVVDRVGAVLGLELHTITRFWGRQVVRVALAPRQEGAAQTP